MFRILMICVYSCLYLGWIQAAEPQSEVIAIDRQIQELQTRLHRDHLIEMGEEVEGQEYMIADWEAYSQELEQIHKHEDENRQIQKQIHKLEQRKAQLLMQQPH